MDNLTCLTSLELDEFLNGWFAARAGQPFESGQTDYWQSGYRFRLDWERDPTAKPVLH